jgi:hypothetical protein
MGDAQALLRTDIEQFSSSIDAYTTELRKELNAIIDHVVQVFNQEAVGRELSSERLVEAMMGRPIVYCGGGSVFPNMRVTHHYFSDKRLINKDTLNIPNLINRGLEPVHYTILATAYGLSIPSFEEIKTIDARQLWKTIANNAGFKSAVPHGSKDYGIIDD